MPEFSNLCDAHRSACTRRGEGQAVQYYRDDVLQTVSWSAYRRAADQAAAGFTALGIEPGDRVALLSTNGYEWLVTDHGLLSCGAVSVPLHAPLAAKQIEYQVSHSQARGILVADQEQADKVAASLPELPLLEWVVAFDDIEFPTAVRILSWQELLASGNRVLTAEGSDTVRERERLAKHDTLATIIYTSGTTGPPKGVMLSHGNLLSNAEAMLARANLGDGDLLFSWLPYSHIYARTVDHYTTTLGNIVIHLADPRALPTTEVSRVQPTWVTSVPRFYEKIWESVAQQPAERHGQILRGLFGPYLRQLSSGGAPLPRHVCEGFWQAGVELYEGYGLTESSPVISFNYPGHARIGSVGQALGGVEIRIAGDGEILTRGPHVMLGYWRNEEATDHSLVDGWLHTGDVGYLDEDGYLFITDRKKDLIVTSGGKNVAPSVLERLLVSDPLIDQAVVYGDGRPYITALLVANVESLQAEAESLGATWQCDDDDFVTTPELIELMEQHAAEVLKEVSHTERVKRCAVLARPLTLEADQLTPTLKVRRQQVLQQHRQKLDALYE